MGVLIIQHVEIEGPGLIETFLRQEKIPHRILNLNGSVRFPKIDPLNHIVILGGPMNVYEEDRFPFLRDEDFFIKESIQRGRPILGICLGAQLIAKALGAKVFKAPVKEIGWYDVSLTRIGSQDPLFSDFPNTFSVFQWHEDTFEVPHGANLIARSAHVPHQAFRYGENVYGLQFHLEVTEQMIREWIKNYGEEFRETRTSLVSKLKMLSDTEVNMETYTKRGKRLFGKFFGQSAPKNRRPVEPPYP